MSRWLLYLTVKETRCPDGYLFAGRLREPDVQMAIVFAGRLREPDVQMAIVFAGRLREPDVQKAIVFCRTVKRTRCPDGNI